MSTTAQRSHAALLCALSHVATPSNSEAACHNLHNHPPNPNTNRIKKLAISTVPKKM